MHLRILPLLICRWACAGTLALLVPGLAHAQSTTTRVSVGTGGTQGNEASQYSVISLDGRWVAFASRASNLVPGDTNNQQDVFAHDRLTGETRRVSLSTGSAEGNADSYAPVMSANGRWVAFRSAASNLVAGDTNGHEDVFVRDQETGVTTRVSVSTGGAEANAQSSVAVISATGRWVAFSSYASNLVEGDTNGHEDVFVHDQQTAATTRVSIGSAGSQGNGGSLQPALSADGRWVAFASGASTLVEGDTNGVMDVFVHDRQTRITTRVSVAPDGIQGNAVSWVPSISADGRWVAFGSFARTLEPGDNGFEDVFVHDRQFGTTTRVSAGTGGTPGNDHSSSPAISADGRSVAFASLASNLVPGDINESFDVFVHEFQTATTTLASPSAGGDYGNGHSYEPLISADGRWVVFESIATNLVANDSNNNWDVFVHDRGDAGCNITLAQTFVVAPPSGGANSLMVISSSGCEWSAVSNDPSWLTVTGQSSGTVIGGVSYAVAVNAGSPRTGTITIGGQTFTVHQESAEALTPQPPSRLVVSSIVGNTVTLAWDIAPVGVAPTHFVIEGGVNPGEILASLPTPGFAPTFSFDAPAGSFYVRVHAVNGVFRSAASDEILIHVNVPIVPSAPANLRALVNDTTLVLAWTNTYVGGAPTSLILDVTGSLNTSIPLGIGESFSFAGVPAGTYTLALRAQNAAGVSLPSNALTLTFPGACSGPPLTPTNVYATRVGSTVFVKWAAAFGGPAPTQYVLHVDGSFVGSFATTERAMSGTVGPGAYTLNVMAVNTCGASPTTSPQTIVVP